MKEKKAHYWTVQFQVTRQIWSQRNLERREVFSVAKHKVNGVDKWKCAHCQQLFAKSEVECDHIDPISKNVPTTMQQYILCLERLHAPSYRLQILCRTCHKIKSKNEAHERAKSTIIDEVACWLDVSIDFIAKSISSFDILKKFQKTIRCLQQLDRDLYNEKNIVNLEKITAKSVALHKELLKLQGQYL